MIGKLLDVLLSGVMADFAVEAQRTVGQQETRHTAGGEF